MQTFDYLMRSAFSETCISSMTPGLCSMKESSLLCCVISCGWSLHATTGNIILTHQLLLWVSKGHKKQTALPANSLSMTLSIFLFRRRKKPSLSLLLLVVVFNSGSFLIDRYWLSRRQRAREKEREREAEKKKSAILVEQECSWNRTANPSKSIWGSTTLTKTPTQSQTNWNCIVIIESQCTALQVCMNMYDCVDIQPLFLYYYLMCI